MFVVGLLTVVVVIDGVVVKNCGGVNFSKEGKKVLLDCHFRRWDLFPLSSLGEKNFE